MFSKELQQLDRNTVQYMIDEMQETIDQKEAALQKAEREKQLALDQAIKAENDKQSALDQAIKAENDKQSALDQAIKAENDKQSALDQAENEKQLALAQAEREKLLREKLEFQYQEMLKRVAELEETNN